MSATRRMWKERTAGTARDEIYFEWYSKQPQTKRRQIFLTSDYCYHLWTLLKKTQRSAFRQKKTTFLQFQGKTQTKLYNKCRVSWNWKRSQNTQEQSSKTWLPCLSKKSGKICKFLNTFARQLIPRKCSLCSQGTWKVIWKWENVMLCYSLRTCMSRKWMWFWPLTSK